jgi:hypothetical protein
MEKEAVDHIRVLEERKSKLVQYGEPDPFSKLFYTYYMRYGSFTYEEHQRHTNTILKSIARFVTKNELFSEEERFYVYWLYTWSAETMFKHHITHFTQEDCMLVLPELYRQLIHYLEKITVLDAFFNVLQTRHEQRSLNPDWDQTDIQKKQKEKKDRELFQKTVMEECERTKQLLYAICIQIVQELLRPWNKKQVETYTIQTMEELQSQVNLPQGDDDEAFATDVFHKSLEYIFLNCTEKQGRWPLSTRKLKTNPLNELILEVCIGLSRHHYYPRSGVHPLDLILPLAAPYSM